MKTKNIIIPILLALGAQSCKDRVVRVVPAEVTVTLITPELKTSYQFPYRDRVDAGDLNCQYLNKDGIDDSMSLAIKKVTHNTTISEREELCKNYLSYLKVNGKVFTDGENYDRIKRIRDKMIKFVSNKEIQHNIYLYDSFVQNAFTIFNGDIFVTTALVNSVKNDDELAGIIGHEIGHGQNGHLDAFSNLVYHIMQFGEKADPTLVDIFKGLGIIGVTAAYHKIESITGQSQEIEADIAGCYLASKAGYDPTKVLRFWNERIRDEEVDSTFYGKARQSLSRTHPFAEDRYKCITDYCKMHTTNLSSYVSFDTPTKIEFIFEQKKRDFYIDPSILSDKVNNFDSNGNVYAHGRFTREVIDEDSKGDWVYLSNEFGNVAWIVEDYIIFK